ncbi:MAG: precorrin-2 dehydrogenase/sirohydrochlorin ferrochelatase family protein [Acidimicrobiales bacterium]
MATQPGFEPPTRLFHVALRLEGRACLVVGGGSVGAVKAAGLLECGALVTVVAPEICAAMEKLCLQGDSGGAGRDSGGAGRRPRLALSSVERRPYRAGEAAEYRLVMAATGRTEVDRQVFEDAEAAGVPVNAADDPGSCSFFMPAVSHVGPIAVAVSTGGVSPFLAGWVKRRIGEALPATVALLAEIVGTARVAVRSAGVSSEGLDWSGLVDDTVWPLLECGDIVAARSAASAWVASVLEAQGPSDATAHHSPALASPRANRRDRP